jgi:hypothetical protein
MRTFVFLVGLGLLAAASMAQAEVLTNDDQIRKALVGNTISGEVDGKPFTEYFNPDGTISGDGVEGRYKGQWVISGARMCLHYDDDAKNVWDCSLVDAGDGQLTWTGNGEANIMRLVPGNPGKP